MAVVSVTGGGRSLEYISETPSSANTMAGTRTYWDWVPTTWPDQHTMWPTAFIRQFGPTETMACGAGRDSRTAPLPPIYYPRASSDWIWYSWDLGWLTSQYGPPLAGTTTVTIDVVGVVSLGTRFGVDPYLSGSPQAHDLLACVPATVQSPADLEWRDFDDSILSPASTGSAATNWTLLSSAISGGTARFPARPFPDFMGSGGWTQIGSYHTDDNIQTNPEAGKGTWTVTVDLAAHARDGHLVIVCAGLGQFTQNEALLTEVQAYDGNPPQGTTAFSVNEMWITKSRAQLLWNSVPPEPDNLGVEGRVHFFRGGPGEVPIGVVSG